MCILCNFHVRVGIKYGGKMMSTKSNVADLQHLKSIIYPSFVHDLASILHYILHTQKLMCYVKFMDNCCQNLVKMMDKVMQRIYTIFPSF